MVWYEKDTGSRASRSDFGDAIDFIGWYNNKTKYKNGVFFIQHLCIYLAYHEGHGGFVSVATTKNVVTNVARKVERQAKRINNN